MKGSNGTVSPLAHTMLFSNPGISQRTSQLADRAAEQSADLSLLLTRRPNKPTNIY